MKKAKTLTVVLTLCVAIIITLCYMIATNRLIGTSNNSSIILLQATSNNNTTEKVSTTRLAKDDTKQDSNEEEKLTATSRSGKHEAITDVAETAITEAKTPQAEVTQTETPVEEAVEEQPEDLAQAPVEEPLEESLENPVPTYEGVELEYSAKYNVCSSPLSKSKGVTYYNGHKETYYSQKVLSGNGLKMLNNNGRHVADDGTVRDGDGYIAVACNYLSKGSEIMTSLGPGKVYDTGGMQGKWIDIYVNW